jgi:methylase of polypeptide subunit release factors
MKKSRKLKLIDYFSRVFIRKLFAMTLLTTGLVQVYALELDVAYVETPHEVVELMMEIAGIGPGDYVIDLGTGDGRIVIAAAKRGATGLGIDLDPARILEAKVNAKQEGVSDKLTFIEQDLFETDLSGATVITLYLNSEVNLRLRPALLKLKPGTRIVSHNFDMGDWKPDRYQQFIRNSNGNFLFHEVYYWIVPASLQDQAK